MHSSEKYQWWGPPKNFDQRKNERKISWLELFYDLVYVAAIAQLTHHLASHPTWSNLGFGFYYFHRYSGLG
jgi:low temperature requirement protein LtrA